MNRLWTILLGTLLAAGVSLAATNGVVPTANKPTGVAVTTSTSEADDPVEKAYKKLLEEDDASQEEVDKWIRDNQAFAAQGGGVSDAEMRRRIRERFAPVRKGYEDFIRAHPNHARARIAYGSFLGDIHDEDGAQEQLEQALELETNNPTPYNNLANIYGHTGPVKKAFEYYARAIELNPREPVYYHNFGTTVYLFRKDAMEFYRIDEQAVFNKALLLYSNAVRLDPTNFPLASDVAQTYYGIKPTRTEDALQAWTNALALAHDDIEREGVYLHFARIKLHAGRFEEARTQLKAVKQDMYKDLKARLARNIDEQERTARTNAPAAAPPAKP